MKKKRKLILLALPTALAAIVLLLILNWHIPTRVRVNLTTDRITFSVGGVDKATILDSVALKTVVLEKFERIKLTPENLEVLRPESERQHHVATIRKLVVEAPVVLTPRDARSQSNVTLSVEASDPRALLIIDAINAKAAADVTLETTDDANNLILRVEGQQSSANIGVSVPFKIAIDQSEIKGVKSAQPLTQPLTLRGNALRDSVVEVTGQPTSLVLSVMLPFEDSSALLPQGHVPVTSLKFDRLADEDGKVLSSLTKNTACEISYPDYADKINNVTVTKPDFLWLDELESFTIEELTYSPDKKAMSVKLLGFANKVSSGSPQFVTDHRLTAYNALWNNHKVIAIFAVLCWVSGTTAAFYKFFKET